MDSGRAFGDFCRFEKLAWSLVLIACSLSYAGDEFEKAIARYRSWASKSVLELALLARKKPIPEGLDLEVKEILLQSLGRTDEFSATDLYEVAFTLNGLGITGERVQNALVSGLMEKYPKVDERYTNFRRKDIEELAELVNPSRTLVIHMLRLARYSGDMRAGAHTLDTLRQWAGKYPAVKSCLEEDARKVIEIAVHWINSWRDDLAKQQSMAKKGVRGAKARVDSAVLFLAMATAAYRQFTAWWPDAAHVLPRDVDTLPLSVDVIENCGALINSTASRGRRKR